MCPSHLWYFHIWSGIIFNNLRMKTRDAACGEMWMEYGMCLDLTIQSSVLPRKSQEISSTARNRADAGEWRRLLEITAASWKKRQMSFLLPWGENRIVFSLYKPQFLTDSLKQMPLCEETEIQHKSFFLIICSESDVVWLSQLEVEMKQLEGSPLAVHSILQFSIWRKLPSGSSISTEYRNSSWDDDKSLQYPKPEIAARCIFNIENDDNLETLYYGFCVFTCKTSAVNFHCDLSPLNCSGCSHL